MRSAALMALVAARSHRWPVLWAARNFASPAAGGSGASPGRPAPEASEPKVAPAAPPRGPAWGRVALRERLVVSLTAQAAGVSSMTRRPAASAPGRSRLQLEKPKTLVDSVWNHCASGGLSTVMNPPGSKAPKKKLRQEWPMDRTAAA